MKLLVDPWLGVGCCPDLVSPNPWADPWENQRGAAWPRGPRGTASTPAAWTGNSEMLFN